MSEPKRVSFMTIDTAEDFPKKSEKEALGGKKKTFRVEVEIFEPDEYKFPDYNYKKLLFFEKKKQKKIAKLSNGTKPAAAPPSIADDPFGDNDEDDIARIARQMEAKYGAGSSYNKTVEIDRGHGYDDNDSFIDNTEAYDEIIPDDIETDRGGFYVNSGLLEFKKKPNFERPGDEIHMPRAKKRILDSSSESEGEGKKDKASTSAVKSKKKKMNDEKKVKSATASSSSDDQGKAAKKAKKDKQEKKPEALVTVKEVEKKKPAAVEKEQPLSDDKKAIKTTTVKDMLRLKRDNMRKMEQSKSSGGGTTTTTDNDDDDGSESVSSLAVSESSHESNAEAPPETPTNGTKELSLPSSFPPELSTSINSLKEYADKNKSNANFFDNHVKNQLLKIDDLARAQGISLQVYKQLEIFIPSPKKTILTKVNRFRVQQAENRVKNEIKKLKTAVNTIMPDLVRKFDEELKNFESKKNISHIIGGDSPVTENKAPRRKFHWNENLRQILFDIVQFISEHHQISKAKKEPLNEYTAKYLKDHVMPIWPEEWIKAEDFQKELDKKKKKEARSSQGNSPQSTNGKQSQKSEQTAMVNGKSPPHSSSLPSQSSVIKRSSDHSINSIINSASPSPPAVSQSNSKTHVVELEKLMNPSDLLKISQPTKIPKFNLPPSTLDVISPEKFRISDGSDSDCAIIESPIKSTTIKPQPQFPSHHLNNNNKISHSQGVNPTPATPPQQQQREKEKKSKKPEDFSSLINSIESLTGNRKDTSMTAFGFNPLSSPSTDQRKVNTSHGINGTSDVPQMKAATKSYSSNLHYAINDLHLIKGSAKSSDYQYTSSMTNNIVQNVSVITSTTDVGKGSSAYSMPPVLNLSNKK